MAQVHACPFPLGGLVDDAVADLLEHLGFRHPHAGPDEAFSRLEVQVVAGSVYAFSARLEMRRGVRLVTARLVLGTVRTGRRARPTCCHSSSQFSYRSSSPREPSAWRRTTSTHTFETLRTYSG